MSNPQYVTVFDLDKTLLQQNSSFRFGAYLYRKGFFRFPTLLRLLFDYVCHKYGICSLPILHHRIFRKLFLGQEQAYIESCVIEFLDHELYALINPSLHRILHKVQHHGHFTLLLSSSPHFLVRPIAQHFLFDAWEATRYTTDAQGRFLHVGTIMEGKKKKETLVHLAKQYGIPTQQITVYTDSILDLPLLEVAGNPIVVNPDRLLRNLAKKRGWHILRH